MDDLTTFLRACLDDDERVARDALPGPWEAQWWGVQTAYEYDRPGYINHGQRVPIAHNSGTVGNRQAEIRNVEHIARWDPARVLADIDAKRRILELHAGEHECREMRSGTYSPDWPDSAPWGKAGDRWTHAFSEYFEDVDVCPTVRLLALPHADREGYREEWRP